MGLIHGLNTALDTQPTSLQWYQDTGFSSLKSAADGDIDDLLIDVPIEHNHLRRGPFTPLLYPHAATIGVWAGLLYKGWQCPYGQRLLHRLEESGKFILAWIPNTPASSALDGILLMQCSQLLWTNLKYTRKIKKMKDPSSFRGQQNPLRLFLLVLDSPEKKIQWFTSHCLAAGDLGAYGRSFWFNAACSRIKQFPSGPM